MSIALSRHSEIPLYKQVAAYFRMRIELGELEAGTKLPSIRQLARTQGLNRITVETASAELEADGLVASRQGSGTFVLPSFAPQEKAQEEAHTAWPRWQYDAAERYNSIWRGNRLPLRTGGMDGEIIHLAGGNSDPRLFPIDAFRKTLRDIMLRDGTDALSYEEDAGYMPLRQTIARILVDQGIATTPDNIIVTTGSQQAIYLIAQVVLQAGDTVYTEVPTYTESMNLFRALGMNIVSIPMDEGGMIIEKLQKELAVHGKGLIITMPTFHNPTGICMNGHRRRQLAAIAETSGIPVVEDDYAGDIRYDGHSQPAIKSLSAAGTTIYIGTFSKMLMPGLRVGYIVAEGPVREHLIRYKRMLDLSTSGIVQRTLERFVDVGSYRNHLNRLCRTYRLRRDTLLTAAELYLPDDVFITPPDGGLFAWLQLPDDLSAEKIDKAARKHGVSVADGRAFFPDPDDGNHYLRINFCQHSAEILTTAIQRLGAAMHSCR
ncbi:PLP-dependent aminotransferase family protein [Oleidesulfovibrio sp.]|uniref:MocR-like pyridoxine biosynthesis transcription factor PdxR n=1 Tax=Oleidesulfovibrio sp. TaxID=2909707 RepID=UPI003A867C27